MLAKYLDDPGNLFIISSDFCHWGDRFNFTFYDEHKVRITRTNGCKVEDPEPATLNLSPKTLPRSAVSRPKADMFL